MLEVSEFRSEHLPLLMVDSVVVPVRLSLQEHFLVQELKQATVAMTARAKTTFFIVLCCLGVNKLGSEFRCKDTTFFRYEKFFLVYGLQFTVYGNREPLRVIKG